MDLLTEKFFHQAIELSKLYPQRSAIQYENTELQTSIEFNNRENKLKIKIDVFKPKIML